MTRAGLGGGPCNLCNSASTGEDGSEDSSALKEMSLGFGEEEEEDSEGFDLSGAPGDLATVHFAGAAAFAGIGCG